MSSRRSVRQLLVAVLLGVLVGGGLMAVTPAGAEVSNAVATNWKKIWKKNLKPLADKRYYTKAQSDTKYSTKTETAAGDAASTAAANAATDSKLSGYYKKAEVDARSYTKAESDAKYAPYPSVIRGTYSISIPASAAGQYGMDGIGFGYTLDAAPTVKIILAGQTPPVGCSGTPTSPDAAPGYLCVFEGFNNGRQTLTYASPRGFALESSKIGISLHMTSSGAGFALSYGSWAVRPASVSVAAPRPAPASGDVTKGATSYQ